MARAALAIFSTPRVGRSFHTCDETAPEGRHILAQGVSPGYAT
jgi:hypothetical protein